MRTEVFIDIDISKPQLAARPGRCCFRQDDVFILATGKVLEFANSPAGIQAFVKFAKKG